MEGEVVGAKGHRFAPFCAPVVGCQHFPPLRNVTRDFPVKRTPATRPLLAPHASPASFSLVCYGLIPTCSRTMRSSSASSRSFVSFTTTVWVPGISCPLGVSGRRCSCAKFASTVRRKSSDWKRGLRKPLGPWPPHLVLGTQSPLLACRRHYPGRSDGICPLERFHSLRPSLDSWRVGSCINDFGACSAFTYVTACTLAKSPSDSLHQRLQQSRCLHCCSDCYRAEPTGSRAGIPPLWTSALHGAHEHGVNQDFGAIVVRLTALASTCSSALTCIETNRATNTAKYNCPVTASAEQRVCATESMGTMPA
jgi:hypothetical protein